MIAHSNDSATVLMAKDFGVESLIPGNGDLTIYVINIYHALFQHIILAPYKPFVYFAKIYKYWIYGDKLTGGIIIYNKTF